jgi:pimeloyl-ACP methyl ester carboxylesterase
MKINRVARYRKTRLAALVAVAAAAGLLILAGLAASAHASARTARAGGPKPSIVLVHGAFADASSWDGVVNQLQRDGYTVYAPPDPLRGIHYDSAYLADFLHSITGPIVLVGHSYGGTVITNAATGDSQVRALVYVDAFLPAQGETLGQLVSAVPGTCAAPANLVLVPYPSAPPGVTDDYIKPSAFPSCLANGLPASLARVLATTQRPASSTIFTQESGVPAWKTIPSWAVLGSADHTIPPAELLAMARRAHARITIFPGAPHLSMVADPGIVTQVILQAVRATT